MVRKCFVEESWSGKLLTSCLLKRRERERKKDKERDRERLKGGPGTKYTLLQRHTLVSFFLLVSPIS
jgi:hypothetical protein